MTGTNVRPMIESSVIQHRVRELAAQIVQDYAEELPVLLGVLNGAARFMMDLLTAFPEDVADRMIYDFVGAASYAGQESTGCVTLTHEAAVELGGRHVLVVDGIADSGLTLQRVVRYVRERSARSVRACVLLDKAANRQHAVTLDYTGFQIENVFVVGYGLDLDQRWRSLRHIGIVS